MISTLREEIHRRIEALQAAMNKGRYDGALILQRADLLYFTGSAEDAHLFVPAEGSPILLIPKESDSTAAQTPVETVIFVDDFADVKKRVESVYRSMKTLGMELDVLPVNMYRNYEALFDGVEIKDCSGMIREIRMVKSEYELDLIRQAAQMNDAMFSQVPEILQEGMTEIEFSGHLEAFLRTKGHEGLIKVRSFNQEIFYGHIMSGVNLAVPSCAVGPTGGSGPNPSLPHGSGFKVIKRHEPVQIDYVSVVGGYIVDQARTFFLGEPHEKFLRVHSLALSIQQALASQGVPGVSSRSLYETAIRMAQEAGCEEGFMGYPEPVPFVGHGVGLELDELPVIGARSPHIMQTGMVIALEPKFIFPNEGLAGIENCFVVAPGGMEKLTQFDDEIQALP